jgi:chromosome partitioning protein
MPQPKLRDRTKRLSFLNQKGGVGKSTFTLYVGAAAAELGARVLVRDMDSQANVTLALAPEGVEFTMNDLLKPQDETGEVVAGSLASAIRPAGTQWPRGLYLVAAELAQAAREGDNGPEVMGREHRLRTVSEGATDAFDLVINDCPPAIGQLTINALVDSDEAYIVTMPELWPLQGAHQAARTIERVKRYYHPELRFAGVYVNGFRPGGTDGRVESRARVTELREEYGELIREPIVNDIEAIRKSVGALAPLSTYGPEARDAANLFRRIAEDLLKN